MKVLPLLGTFAVLIAGQDTTPVVVFSPNGNGSSLVEIGSKIEPVAQPDMTRGVVSASLLPPQPQQQPQPQPQPMLPSDYFFPGKDFSILVTLRRRGVSFDHLSFVRAAIIERLTCRAWIVALNPQSREIILKLKYVVLGRTGLLKPSSARR